MACFAFACALLEICEREFPATFAWERKRERVVIRFQPLASL